MTKNNIKKAVVQAIYTSVALGLVIMQVKSAQAATLAVNNLNDSDQNSIDINVSELRIINDSNATILDSTTNGGNISISSGNIVLSTNVTIPVSTTNGNSEQISGGSNNGGNIIVTASDVILLTTVPEPSALAGSILACSLAWLAKRNLAAFRKPKI
jgi:hypothetical protein